MVAGRQVFPIPSCKDPLHPQKLTAFPSRTQTQDAEAAPHLEAAVAQLHPHEYLAESAGAPRRAEKDRSGPSRGPQLLGDIYADCVGRLAGWRITINSVRGKDPR